MGIHNKFSSLALIPFLVLLIITMLQHSCMGYGYRYSWSWGSPSNGGGNGYSWPKPPDMGSGGFPMAPPYNGYGSPPPPPPQTGYGRSPPSPPHKGYGYGSPPPSPPQPPKTGYGSPPPGHTGDDNSQQAYLDAHNAARALVGVGKMKWSATVAAYAQSYADTRKADCALQHSVDDQYGECIAEGSDPQFSGVDAVKLWVDEKAYYDHKSNTCASGQVCGHYTQVVWNNSVNLGCARVVCDKGGVFITCNYDPPGNYVGQSPY